MNRPAHDEYVLFARRVPPLCEGFIEAVDEGGFGGWTQVLWVVCVPPRAR
jgi:hypothetical protein